jgi:hypothetical protein
VNNRCARATHGCKFNEFAASWRSVGIPSGK